MSVCRCFPATTVSGQDLSQLSFSSKTVRPSCGCDKKNHKKRGGDDGGFNTIQPRVDRSSR